MSRVAFVGAWDPDYPRNRMIRMALARAGHVVQEVRVRPNRAFRRYPALAAALGRSAMDCDVMWVPEFRHKDVLPVRWLSGHRPLVFDPLVSRWDTLVGDWAIHARDSAQARWNRAIDRLSLGAADRVVCDTWAHGELFRELGVKRSALCRIPVGAEPEFFDVPSPPGDGPVRVFYLGGFLPLHGVATMVDAVARLEAWAPRLPEFIVELAGRGIEHDAMRARALSLGLQRVEFPGPSAYRQAAGRFTAAHIVLGAFGTGDKTRRVVPHKLWQGLAAARAVVTGDVPAVREWFRDREHLRLVPCGDPDALASVLAELIADSGARTQLGRSARLRARECGSVEALAPLVHDVLRGVRP